MIQDVSQVLIREMFVAIRCDGGFEFGHAVKVPKEDSSVDAGRIETFIAKFTEKASVAVIGVIIQYAQVLETVVRGHTVDMINGHPFRDHTDPCAIDGMGDVNVYVMPPSIAEKQILLLGSVTPCFLHYRIDEYFAPVGIDAYAIGPIPRDIERVPIRMCVLPVPRHKFDKNVVEYK